MVSTEQNMLPTIPKEPRTIDELLRSRVASIPDKPIIGYPGTEHGSSDYVYYTPRQLDRFTNGLMDILIHEGLQPNQGSGEKVIALIGFSDLDYIITMLALHRMRFTILLLSTRLATEAYVNLMGKTNCHDLVVSDALLKKARAISAVRDSSIYNMPRREAYEPAQSNASPFCPHEHGNPIARNAFIIHSSGSTGLPKPIAQTQGACLANYRNGNGYKAFMTLPLFHNHGLSTMFRAITTGTPIVLFNANLPPSAANLVEAMEVIQPESFHGVPFVLKLVSEDVRGLELLAKCKLVMFGGSSCPDELGDKLVKAGVYLVAHYGATELGQLMSSFRDKEDKAWNYLRPFTNCAPYLHFAPRGNGTFELIVLDGWRAKVATNSDDPPNSFHTSDTFTPHSTMPNAWKYLGRNDDRITLINGEKVLPVLYENSLRRHELVAEALLFGVGRSIPGLFIIPSEIASTMDKTELLRKLWPAIEEANDRVEAFSQISKEMVEILDAHTDYPATDKRTLIRAASYKKFAPLIDAVYRRFEGESDTGKRLTLSIPDLESFIINAFKERTRQADDIDTKSDFFNIGIDSLQALTIRALLKRKLDLGGRDLGQNVIFEFPTAHKLARHIYALRTGGLQLQEDEVAIMEELISRYSTFDKTAGLKDVNGHQQSGEVVLLTGTTGSLGAHILAQLSVQPSVRQVYCAVRAEDTSSAKKRVMLTLEAREISCNLDKVIFTTCDFSKPDLGFARQVLETLRQSLTKVIHSAWAVNFNLGVRSFERQHIKGVTNLINLCLSVPSSPAQFFFCSSISAAAGTPLPATIAERPVPKLEHAQHMGYARSKLVAERIVQAAANTTGMVAKTLRIGQIVGDSEHGIWNTTEAIPLMIQSAVTMGALPALEETPSWMPVDLVAKSILEISGLETESRVGQDVGLSQTDLVYHIQNTRTFHWTHDLLPALRASGLVFDTVSQKEWVGRLRGSNPDPAKNPTIKLVDFFAEKYDNDGPGRKGLNFATQITEAVSKTVHHGYDIIGTGIVRKMVQQWEHTW